MKKIFRILPAVCLLLALSACSKSDTPDTPPTPEKGNITFNLNAQVIEGSSSRGLDLEATADHARPQITATVGELIDTYLFFAYADKGADGKPTNIQTTGPISTQLKVTKIEGTGNDRMLTLEIKEKNIDIPQYPANKNKMWYVCGVIGGEIKNNTLYYDPNTALLGGEAMSAGLKKKVEIPYTFGWQAITFAPRTVGGTTTDAFYIRNAKFLPRGVFMRLAIKNNGVDAQNKPWGNYVLKFLRIKENTHFAPKANFTLQATPADLTSTGLSGFSSAATGDQAFEFKHTIESVHLGYTDTGINLGYANVKSYQYVVGKDVTNNPSVESKRKERIGYFWVWLAETTTGGNSVSVDLIGDPLGLLRPRQSFNLTGLQIAASKKNTTIAKELTLNRAQLGYMPLEFVARGNAARSYSSGSLNIEEVGQNWTYPGASSIGLWLGGASFGVKELFTWSTENYLSIDLRAKESKFIPNNRFIPTVDDWRTVIPHFREDIWNSEIETHKEVRTRYYEYWDGSKLFVDKIFGVGNSPTFGAGRKDIDGTRQEFNKFRSPDGGEPTTETTKAYYRPSTTDNNVYYGVRHIRELQSNFYERRRYFSAYRVESTSNGLIVKGYYIGTEGSKEGDGTASWNTVESQWLDKIANEDFWKQKMEEGEVIERKFPIGGRTQVGTQIGEWSRYHVQNLRIRKDVGSGADSDFSMFQFKPGFGTAFIGADTTVGDGLNCLLRYFVVDPKEAYQQWGSKN
ncbi:MAG: hypothetical protein MR396_06415 [Phocaeicola sp.]|nr:hypothetical protein [Phocaeicola sp.]MDY3914255.1 hypothetical protein [Phocaeicola sp.]